MFEFFVRTEVRSVGRHKIQRHAHQRKLTHTHTRHTYGIRSMQWKEESIAAGAWSSVWARVPNSITVDTFGRGKLNTSENETQWSQCMLSGVWCTMGSGASVWRWQRTCIRTHTHITEKSLSKVASKPKKYYFCLQVAVATCMHHTCTLHTHMNDNEMLKEDISNVFVCVTDVFTIIWLLARRNLWKCWHTTLGRLYSVYGLYRYLVCACACLP